MRMSRTDRRHQIVLIMQNRYAKAKCRSDFTPVSLASEAGVSVVWFYALVGGQFKKLRESLPDSNGSRKTLLSKLREEVANLRKQLRELKGKYEASLKGKVAEAIHMIERLDKENRMLREKVMNLEKRLIDEKLIISVDGDEN